MHKVAGGTKMNNNPFSLMYGRIPSSFIERTSEFKKIVETFRNENPSTLAYTITGTRGTGKTVLLRAVAKELQENSEFVVVDLNPQEEMISSFGQKLYYEGRKIKIFLDYNLTIDLKYVQLEVGKNDRISNPEVIGERLIRTLEKKKKRILITIDEVNNTPDIKKFANFYQAMIGKGYHIFLLMTGLKNNIDVLIESNATSFLSRTPKITLQPLDLVEIVKEYKKVFSIENDIASQLAKLTKGYAFAYQVLGYFFFESKSKVIDDILLEQYDEYLRKNGYDVIWNELTNKEKELCIAICKSNSKDTAEIMGLANMKESNYQNYRTSLINKGIIEVAGYGKVDFALPRFSEFIKAILVYYL